MTADNEQVVRELFAASEDRATWPRAMALYDETVVLVVGEDVGPVSGVFNGKPAVRRWFADWFAMFDEASFEVRELAQGRDAVATYARHSARGKGSGIEVAADLYYAYWLREGKVVRAEIFGEREAAWRAAGVAG